MGNLSNSDIAKQIIEKLHNNSGIKGQVIDVIAEILTENEQLSRNTAYECAEKKMNAVTHSLDKYIEECSSKHVDPGIHLSHDHLMIRSGRVGSSISLRTQVIHFLQEAIDDRVFEEVCKAILEQFSIGNLSIRKRPDGGWDFDGLINVHNQKSPARTIFFDWNIKVIGQAKKYASTVGRPDIDAFVGVAKRKRDDEKTYIPVVFIFMTTSSFSKGAKDLANRYHIITKDGVQIAEVILKEQIGLKYLDGKPAWDSEIFLNWLKTHYAEAK